jgi:hypothetical protein
MKADSVAARLESNLTIISGLIDGVSLEQARWRPAPEKWSILEVVNHLYDEEREDFRQRIDLLLHHPDRDWPGIDPQGWVTAREYQKRDLAESLRGFSSERKDSVAWLRKLGAVDWATFKEHPRAGRMAAGDLLASWVAHDFQHIRQLTRLHYEYIAFSAKPFSVDYAG